MTNNKAKRKFFISDLHLNHEKMVEKDESGKSARPFSSVKEMNECILTNINETVKDNDKLFILGDVLFQPATSEYLLKQLPKNITLILGNHDELKESTRYYFDYFKTICLWRAFPEGFICTHIPLMPELFRGVKFNVHGHIHEKHMKSPNYINVCVEKTKYKPVSMEEIEAEINKRRPYV